MVPLQSDFDHGTQSHILTCYMFPQQPPADEGTGLHHTKLYV